MLEKNMNNQLNINLLNASRNNNLTLVKQLLKKEADVNFKDEYKSSILNTALDSGNLEIAKLLIENGADVDACDIQGFTALIGNAYNNYIDNIKFLIDNGADVNMSCQGDWTALMFAFEHNQNYDMAKLLIENGADVNQLDNKGYALLCKAIELGDADFVEYLLLNGANVNSSRDKYGGTVLECAIDSGNLEIAKLLIENGADVDACDIQGFTALIGNAYSNNIDNIKFLINNGADVNISCQGDWTALMFACIHNKNYDLAKLLIENGADVNTADDSGNTLLMMACEDGNYKIIKLLIDSNAEINQVNNNGYTPLIRASILGKVDLIEFLLLNGANVNVCDDNGFTSLMHASINKKKLLLFINNSNKSIVEKNFLLERYKDQYDNQGDIVNLLIKNGADINMNSSARLNAYSIANSTKNRQIIEILRKIDTVVTSKAIGESKVYNFFLDVNMQENYLSRALLAKDPKLLLTKRAFKSPPTINVNLIDLKKEDYPIEFLIKAIKDGVDINYQDKQGITALMLAVKTNDKQLVELLLKNGASLDIQDKNEEDVYDYAYNEGHKGIIKILDNSKELRKANSHPKELVYLLSNFTKDTPIKYTTHIWDFGDLRKDYKDFSGFMNKTKEKWNEIEEELKELSPNLHKKIYDFIFNEKPDNWSHEGSIDIGWSSIKGLDEWCNDGNSPFEFKLNKTYMVDGKQINTFGKIINLFKQEIEIRNDNNILESIFLENKEKLGSKFIVELIGLKGKDFYTDVEVFKSILGRIFEEIKKREHYNIKVKAIDTTGEFLELKIIHIDSCANRNSEDMLTEVRDGDWKELAKSLKNLCDWSVESSCENEDYRVNYLRSNSKLSEIETLDYKPEGFTHILRFYRK